MGIDAALEDVPLYLHPGRIDQELTALGIKPDDPLSPEQIFEFDQLHYHGIESVRIAGEASALNAGSSVLDVGSGFGGPARYLAHRFGCKVMAIELQPAMHAAAVRLTERCGLSRLVQHVCGDALTEDWPKQGFDAIVTWLAILHISERPSLCRRFASALRSGGICYIEDLVRGAAFSVSDRLDIDRHLFAPSLSSIDEYVADLRAGGFVEILTTDLTEDWRKFVARRLVKFRAGAPRFIDAHGRSAYEAMDLFFAAIDRYFALGWIGGTRIIARIP